MKIMISIGVVVDNDFVSDVRVQKEVDLLQKNGFQVHILSFGFEGKKYAEPEGVSISRIPIKRVKKTPCFSFSTDCHFMTVFGGEKSRNSYGIKSHTPYMCMTFTCLNQPLRHVLALTIKFLLY